MVDATKRISMRRRLVRPVHVFLIVGGEGLTGRAAPIVPLDSGSPITRLRRRSIDQLSAEVGIGRWFEYTQRMLGQSQRLFIVAIRQQGRHIDRRFQFNDPMGAFHRPAVVADAGHFAQHLRDVKGRALCIEIPADLSAAHIGNRNKAFNRAAHGIKTVG